MVQCSFLRYRRTIVSEKGSLQPIGIRLHAALLQLELTRPSHCSSAAPPTSSWGVHPRQRPAAWLSHPRLTPPPHDAPRPPRSLFHNFLSEAEADHIVGMAEPRLTRSGVVDSDTGVSRVEGIRTSQ